MEYFFIMTAIKKLLLYCSKCIFISFLQISLFLLCFFSHHICLVRNIVCFVSKYETNHTTLLNFNAFIPEWKKMISLEKDLNGCCRVIK